MTDDRTELGLEVEAALNEVLTQVRGERTLPSRIIDEPSQAHIVAVRQKLGRSRRRFAERFHLTHARCRTGSRGDAPRIKPRGFC